MRASDIMVLSMRQLRERRLRSVLTFLAIAVGVTSIIALSAQVEGVGQSITQSLQTLGPDSIMVISRGTQFTEADVVRLKSLDGVSGVTPMLSVNVRVAGLENPVSFVGISSLDLVSFIGELRLLDGSVYYDVPAPQALVGYDIAVDDAGELRYKAGQPILLQTGQSSITLTVVGVLDDYGAALMIQPGSSVFVPIEYVKTLMRTGGYTIILVKAETTEKVDQVTELVGYVFGGRAQIMSVKQISQIVTSIISQISLLFIGITGTSFIAAGLGTFNIMMISVLERVREIGVVKALGMKDRGVLMLYITQGLLLGLFGSIIGVALGVVTAYVLSTLLTAGFGPGGEMMAQGQQQGGGMGGGMGAMGISSFTPVISPTYVGIAVALSIAVTLLSSAYPAWRASKLSPVEALRYE